MAQVFLTVFMYFGDYRFFAAATTGIYAVQWVLNIFYVKENNKANSQNHSLDYDVFYSA